MIPFQCNLLPSISYLPGEVFRKPSAKGKENDNFAAKQILMNRLNDS
jgi:hypothetical protein